MDQYLLDNEEIEKKDAFVHNLIAKIAVADLFLKWLSLTMVSWDSRWM